MCEFHFLDASLRAAIPSMDRRCNSNGTTKKGRMRSTGLSGPCSGRLFRLTRTRSHSISTSMLRRTVDEAIHVHSAFASPTASIARVCLVRLPCRTWGSRRRLSGWGFIPLSPSAPLSLMRPKRRSLVRGTWSSMNGSRRPGPSFPWWERSGTFETIAGSAIAGSITATFSSNVMRREWPRRHCAMGKTVASLRSSWIVRFPLSSATAATPLPRLRGVRSPSNQWPARRMPSIIQNGA